MHDSSVENMKYFVKKYMLARGENTEVLDVGSQEVTGQENTSYRRLIPENIRYTGCDMVSGNNVDIVLKSPYNWKEINSDRYEYVISGQVLEHVEFPWLTLLEIARVLKRGGICCVIAPSSGPMHNYPLDCYRYYPDGMVALARYAHLEVLEVFTNYDKKIYPYTNETWKDTVLIARKPESKVSDLEMQIKRMLLHITSLEGEQRRETFNPVLIAREPESGLNDLKMKIARIAPLPIKRNAKKILSLFNRLKTR